MLLRKEVFHVPKPINTPCFVNVEQVAYNYLNTSVITKNCVSKTEGHPELIKYFQNLRKNRQTDRHCVLNCKYENPSLFICHALFHSLI